MAALESQYSNEIRAMAGDTVAPAKVMNLSYTVSQGVVHLSWDAVVTTELITEYFSGDGENTTFQLSHGNLVDGSYIVSLGGIEQSEDTDYTIDLENGVVVFENAPSEDIDNVRVEYRVHLDDLSGYRIFRKDDASSNFVEIDTVSATVDSQVTTYDDTTMNDGASYIYAVSAFDDEETPNEGELSDELSVKTIPSVPQNLRASGGDRLIELKWDDVKDDSDPKLNENLAGYKVYRSNVSGGPYQEVGQTAEDVTEFIDTNVENNVEYFYVVTSFDNSQ